MLFRISDAAGIASVWCGIPSSNEPRADEIRTLFLPTPLKSINWELKSIDCDSILFSFVSLRQRWDISTKELHLIRSAVIQLFHFSTRSLFFKYRYLKYIGFKAIPLERTFDYLSIIKASLKMILIVKRLIID